MERYESYKDSGVAWIGKVPEHWEVMKTSLLYTNIGSGTTPSTSKQEYYEDDGFCWLQTGDLNDGYITDTSKKISKVAIKDCKLRFYPVGSIVIAMYGATIGKIGLLKVPTSTNQACCVLPYSNKMNEIYTFYVCQIAKGQMLLEAVGGGQPNISQDIIKKLKLPVPPICEQQAIAAYLDKRCSEIDKAIATQQKRVALLQELKQSIITHAVTRGIHPDVPLKESGVEWIGNIPEHWEVAFLKRYCSIKTGSTPSTKESKFYDSEDINWFTPGDFQSDILFDSNKKISDFARACNACKIFPARSIYMIGIGGTIGKIAVCNEIASANQQINIIIPNRKVYYKYVHYCLISQKEEIILSANVVTLPIINQDKTGYLLLPIPPLNEQEDIVAYIEYRCKSIDYFISKAKRQIELLQELKQSVITEAITGKIKVC